MPSDVDAGLEAPASAAEGVTEGDRSVSPVNVLVLGMHRSGTSAVSELLRRAGFSTGAPGHENPANFANPIGYSERTDIIAFDDELLSALGWTWDSPTAHVPASPSDRPIFVQRGRTLIQREFPALEPWFIKDPRISLLLPWWRKILVDRFVAVVAWRPLEEIAWSLHVRDETPLALGVALTGAYLRHLAAGLQGLPVIMVDYTALTSEPERVVPALLDALHEVGVRGDFDADSAIGAIDRTLRRSTQPSEPSLEELISHETMALITAWPRGGLHLVRRFSHVTNHAAPWEGALLDLQRRLRTAQQNAARSRREVDDLKAELERAQGVPSSQPAIPPVTQPDGEPQRVADPATEARLPDSGGPPS